MLGFTAVSGIKGKLVYQEVILIGFNFDLSFNNSLSTFSCLPSTMYILSSFSEPVPIAV